MPKRIVFILKMHILYTSTALSGEQLAQLILGYIDSIQSTGVKVRAVVLDAHPSNVSACTHLGCDFNPDALVTHFPYNQDKIFIFFDVCHSLKLIRNLLGDRDMQNSSGGVIKWEYFKKLNSLQNEEGLHLANKLTNKHIEFKNHKMKVAVAAQTLSK